MKTRKFNALDKKADNGTFSSVSGFLIVLAIIPFFLISTAASTFGEEVTAPVYVATSSVVGATLAIPRWKGYMSELNTNNFWISYSNGSVNCNMKYTTDAGQTWSSNDIHIDGYLDFHLSAFGEGENLYFTFPAGTGVKFRKFNSPSHSDADAEPLVPIEGTTVWNRSNIMVQNTGRIWLFTRRGGDIGENVLYHYSDNNGADWTSGVAVAAGIPDVRIGSMPYVNGNPALIVFYDGDDRGYEYYFWNGSSFEAKNDHSIYALNMGSTRVFTHNVINDTTMHLIFGYGNELHHLWKNYNNGNGAWNHQVIDTSSSTFGNDWYNVSTVQGNNLYLFYCKKSSGDDASSRIFYKKWSQLSESWTDPVMVSAGAGQSSCRDPNTCFHVPDNANYIPVFWGSGASSVDIYFAKIMTELDTIPPGKIIDLGASSGTDLGEIDLIWTATGDDGYVGTAARYEVRYSVDNITEANWSSAAILSNPPNPLPDGETEECTIGDLIEGETYYIAAKALDEADNISQISDVVSAKATGFSLDVDTDDPINMPDQGKIINNTPNPFNSLTRIKYHVPFRSYVSLSIYDILGKKVNTIVDGPRAAGDYFSSWDGCDNMDNLVASGIYFCRLNISGLVDSHKMLLLK